MSNKSRRRPVVPKEDGATIGDVLKQFGEELAKKQKEKAENGLEEMTDEPYTGPSGMLPLPTRQIVRDRYYEWEWEPILDTVRVTATFIIDDETWYIDSAIDKAKSFHPNDAKKIGEAFLAASNWQYIWKEHFADMMLNDARRTHLAPELKTVDPIEPEPEIAEIEFAPPSPEVKKAIKKAVGKTDANTKAINKMKPITHKSESGETHMGARLNCPQCDSDE